MEHNSSGHFYFFGNRAWYDSFQGPAYDNHAKGGVFKTPKEVPAVAGKHYVFHNSFCTHGDYMRNWVLTRFLHSNNAIRFAHAGDPGVTDPTKLGAMFGDLGEPPANLCKRFTTDWRVLCITMDTDVVAHAEWPATVLAKGYPIRPAAGADPVFISPFTGDLALAPREPVPRRCPAIGDRDGRWQRLARLRRWRHWCMAARPPLRRARLRRYAVGWLA